MEKRRFEIHGEDINGESKILSTDTREEAEKFVVLYRRFDYRNVRIVENLFD